MVRWRGFFGFIVDFGMCFVFLFLFWVSFGLGWVGVVWVGFGCRVRFLLLF